MKNDRNGQAHEGIWHLLALLRHTRLAVLLVCLGLVSGVAYYTYARAVYQSRALIHYEITDLPLRDESRDGRMLSGLDLRDSLRSAYMTERTALRMGLTKGMGAYELIRDTFVPKIEVALIDGSTLRMDVFAYDPSLVSKWQQAMVQEFNTYYQERRKQQREERTRLFRDELDSLSKKMDQERKEKLTFEEENSITELFIKQAGLTQVPRDMVLLRHQLAQMEQFAKSLASSKAGPADKLNLLATFNVDPGASMPVSMPLPEPGRVGQSLDALAPSSLAAAPAVAESLPTTVVPQDDLSESNAWRTVERERQNLAEQVESAGRTYLPGHPKMRELLAKKEEADRALAQHLEAALARFQAREAQTRESLSRLEAQLPDYREINRKFEDFRQSYQLQQNRNLAWADAHAALAKRIATMEYAGDEAPARLEFMGYNLMRDKDPVSPPKIKLLLMSLALGMALGVAVPYGLQKLDDTMARLDDAQDALDIQGLGVVPVYGAHELENIVRSPEIDAEHPDRLLEDFRIIRSSIALNREMEIPTQVIMVTSARPGEGKSTICANLAWAFASMGERTLLIDCDLRRGRLHHVLAVDNTQGLTDVLTRGVDVPTVTQRTALAGLDVITRGPIAPGATEGLCRPLFAEVLAQLRPQYTRIVIDTPPVLGLSEASSLQRVVDGTVLVILAEQTRQGEIQQALELLRKSGGRLYGFILNRLELRKAANYYHYSYYSPYYYDAVEHH